MRTSIWISQFKRPPRGGLSFGSLMSAIGPKRTCACALHMSAFRCEADVNVGRHASREAAAGLQRRARRPRPRQRRGRRLFARSATPKCLQLELPTNRYFKDVIATGECTAFGGKADMKLAEYLHQVDLNGSHASPPRSAVIALHSHWRGRGKRPLESL